MPYDTTIQALVGDCTGHIDAAVLKLVGDDTTYNLGLQCDDALCAVILPQSERRRLVAGFGLLLEFMQSGMMMAGIVMKAWQPISIVRKLQGTCGNNQWLLNGGGSLRRLASAVNEDAYCDDGRFTEKCYSSRVFAWACDPEDNRVCETEAIAIGYPEEVCDDKYCGSDGVQNWEAHCEDKYCEGVPTIAVIIGNILTVIPLAALSLTKRCASRLLN